MKRGKIYEAILGLASLATVFVHAETRHNDNVRRSEEARLRAEKLDRTLAEQKAKEETLGFELAAANAKIATLEARLDPVQIYEKADYLASLVVVNHEPPILPIIPPTSHTGGGAGFLIRVNDELYLLSARHVVMNTDETIVDSITVRLKIPGSIPHSAEVVGWDYEFDLALLRFNDGFTYDGPAAELEDSASLTPYAPVMAMGSPFSLEFSGTLGYIANVNSLGIHNTKEKHMSVRRPQALIHSAPLVPGHSGGPLINAENGKVVGLNLQIMAYVRDKADRFYIAVPSEDIIRLIPKLAKGGVIRHGFIPGVTVRDSAAIPTADFPDKRRLIAEGVVVTGTEPDTLGGLTFRQKDLILEINGMPIADAVGFMREIMHQDPGAIAHIKLIRAGTVIESSIKLEEHAHGM